jgi:hypothetical protein
MHPAAPESCDGSGYNLVNHGGTAEGYAMSADHRDSVVTWLKHIGVLAGEIGPRGSTTEGERRGSEYCAQALRELGFEARVEPFKSARSIYQPHLFAALIMLASFGIYPLAGRASAVVAALLAVLALVSDLMELGFRDNILRRLVPKGHSQNARTWF